MERLLPGSPELALEHIFELLEGDDSGEVAFICPFIELGDRLIDGKFDTVLAVILVDFDMTLVFWIVALQLVLFGQGVLVVPALLHLIERWMFID